MQALVETADSGVDAAKRNGRNMVWSDQPAITPATWIGLRYPNR